MIEVAAVLCGGQGTRLRSAIGEHQKCVTQVAGVPMLHRVLDQVASAGVKRLILLTGYQDHEVRETFLAWRSRGRFAWCNFVKRDDGVEPAVALAHMWATRLLLLNGDTLAPGFDLGAFLRAYPDRHCVTVRAPSAATGAVAEAGVWIRCACKKHGRAKVHPSGAPFYDIGTPEGLRALEGRLA